MVDHQVTPPEATLLVTAAGRRTYVVEALLAAAPSNHRLVVADADGDAPTLANPQVVPLISPDAADRGYPTWLLETCQRYRVAGVLSLHDYEALRLADAREDLRAIRTRFIGCPLPALELLLDKCGLATHVEQRLPNGSVPTYTEGDLRGPAAARLLDGPLVIKDRHGSGSSGLAHASGLDEARRLLAARPRRTWVHPLRGQLEVELVAQPVVPGPEYNVDLFLDGNSQLRGSCVKRKLRMRGGETDAAHVLTDPPGPVLDAAFAAVEGLGCSGNIDVDVFCDGGTPQVVDVNPRFGGGYAFSALAGYRAAEATWDVARGRAVAPFPAHRELRAAKHVVVTELRQLEPAGTWRRD